MNKFNLFFCIILASILFTSCATSPPAPTQKPTSTNFPTLIPVPTPLIETGEITSQALANNLLGDPATRKFNVYLPPDYKTSGKHYPVVYVLNWYEGNADSSIPVTAEYLSWLIAYDKVKPMILVYPDASNLFGGSLYRSSPTIGDYETYITQELVQQIDATYRTIPNRESRGVMGCSMGGFGALHLGLKYPDVFGVAAPMSAVTYDWENYLVWLSAITQEPEKISDLQSISQYHKYLLAAAAAAASNPDKPPFYLDMPVEFVDGKAQIAPEVFRKMTALDPMNDVVSYLAQPIRLRGLLLYNDTDIGDDPEGVSYVLGVARQFDQSLTSLGIDHQYVEVDAPHCEYDWTPILEFMGATLVY